VLGLVAVGAGVPVSKSAGKSSSNFDNVTQIWFVNHLDSLKFLVGWLDNHRYYKRLVFI